MNKPLKFQVQHHKSPGEIETSTSTITSSTTECTKTVASPSKKTAVRERWMTVQRKTNNSTVLKYSSHDSVPVSSVTTRVQSVTNSSSAPIVKLNRSSDSISKGRKKSFDFIPLLLIFLFSLLLPPAPPFLPQFPTFYPSSSTFFLYLLPFPPLFPDPVGSVSFGRIRIRIRKR